MIVQEAFFTRHLDLIPIEILDKKITVVGCGAVGSHVIMSLIRMGFKNIEIWDDDTVSEENMGSQGFLPSQIGTLKVEGLEEMANQFGTNIKTNDRRVDSMDFLESDVIVAAVDSMKARHEIFQAYNSRGLFIDPRMGAEYAKMFSINKDKTEDASLFEKSFYSDEEAVQEACTAKATVYCANLLSGVVVKTIKDYLLGHRYIRTLDWNIRENSMICYDNEKNRL